MCICCSRAFLYAFLTCRLHGSIWKSTNIMLIPFLLIPSKLFTRICCKSSCHQGLRFPSSAANVYSTRSTNANLTLQTAQWLRVSPPEFGHVAMLWLYYCTYFKLGTEIYFASQIFSERKYDATYRFLRLWYIGKYLYSAASRVFT